MYHVLHMATIMHLESSRVCAQVRIASAVSWMMITVAYQ